LIVGTLADVTRSKGKLIAENALLRQQVIILLRQVRTFHLTQQDRGVLVMLARWVRRWKDALAIVKPNTLLGWHRHGFRLCWRHKSRTPYTNHVFHRLIKQMAVDNRLWGAKWIQDELKKFGIHVSKRTIQRHMRQVRKNLLPRRSSQTRATFLKNHANEIWAWTL
jgi:putative transposase